MEAALKINPSQIDWENKENYFFIHPQKKIIFNFKFLEKLSGCLFISTSGTKEEKCAVLPKKAFLVSAQSVNTHLKVQKKDRWLVALPLFHVGGLSILARSFLSCSKCFVLKEKWSPKFFSSCIEEKKITLTSLVPAQVYDLVSQKIQAPSFLRAVIVGGGFLHKSLYYSARKLGWPLLPSYGLTEAGSQVATANLESLKLQKYPKLFILDHCKVRIRQKDRICIQSPSLFLGYCLQKPRGKKILSRPFDSNWFITEDRGEVTENTLKVFGRGENFVKIKGENTSLYRLENLLMKVLAEMKFPSGKYQIIFSPNKRSGSQVDLAASDSNIQTLIQLRQIFNDQVISAEKIQNCYVVLKIPLSSLSKVSIPSLKRNLGF